MGEYKKNMLLTLYRLLILSRNNDPFNEQQLSFLLIAH